MNRHLLSRPVRLAIQMILAENSSGALRESPSRAVIYGANASGKSNVLAALAFMRAAVLDSLRRWNPEGGVPRTAFAWGGKRSEPSTFETTFVDGGTKINTALWSMMKACRKSGFRRGPTTVSRFGSRAKAASSTLATA